MPTHHCKTLQDTHTMHIHDTRSWVRVIRVHRVTVVQCAAVYSSVLHVAVSCSVLKCVAVCCVLQCMSWVCTPIAHRELPPITTHWYLRICRVYHRLTQSMCIRLSTTNNHPHQWPTSMCHMNVWYQSITRIKHPHQCPTPVLAVTGRVQKLRWHYGRILGGLSHLWYLLAPFPFPLPYPLSLSQCLSLSHPLSLALSHSLTRSLGRALSYPLPLPLSLCISIHTHTHTRTHTCTNRDRDNSPVE